MVETVFITDDEREAFDYEIKLILDIGREDIGTGSLFNLTAGGEGQSGRLYSKDEISSKSVKMLNYWKSLSDEEKKEMGRRSLEGRTSEGVAAGAAKQKKTKSRWSSIRKDKIESKRKLGWSKAYYNRSDAEKQETSDKCRLAGYKRSMYFIKFLYDGNLREMFLKDMIAEGIARDGIMYRIKGKVDLTKPFKSRTTKHSIQLISYEMRNDYNHHIDAL